MPRPKLNRKCSIEECSNRHHARGFCMRHYSKTDFKKESNKQYRLRNPVKLKQWRKGQDRRYKDKYPDKIRALSAKHRAIRAEGLVRFGWIDEKLISNYYTRVCGICGLKIESRFEIDHIIPLARNGSNTLDNLQLAHPICNRTKSDRLQKDINLDIMILRELIL